MDIENRLVVAKGEGVGERKKKKPFVKEKLEAKSNAPT